ncbi:MAG TPA: DUF3616 domain-containing protein [Polaromonas sp.]|uniref:DUF3616 domain-containing protein n=1 Tax=Polaromonas sp. TaxID=1869339 RepID=UPI002D31AA68|nr:DUF3616 domain-containing protein [Polaromonas sp.]HYW57923.1 DUF3616 domain-containing protein [Polaromonas sp.]
MKPLHTIKLSFLPRHDEMGGGKELRDGLSVALQVGNTLWVANDESTSLERLVLGEGRTSGKWREAGQHRQFALADYLRLPEPGKGADVGEVDIEGLAHAQGYMWLVGSHSLKRKKPAQDEAAGSGHKLLAEISVDGNRYLLARIPLVEEEGSWTLRKKTTQRGRQRTAAQLKGNAKGNALTQALKRDKHLGAFLAVPGKDNGFDIEGLAVVGKRLFLGLRGPVLNGWAVIVEIEPELRSGSTAELQLKPIGRKKRLYRKHFLQLGGLGIRDLCMQGKDMLILAGPTMVLDGPVSVFRWPDAGSAKGEQLLGAEELPKILDLPYGQGVDHPEGMSLLSPPGGGANGLVVVYDAASTSRQPGQSAMWADVFTLPKPSSRAR